MNNWKRRFYLNGEKQKARMRALSKTKGGLTPSYSSEEILGSRVYFEVRKLLDLAYKPGWVK